MCYNFCKIRHISSTYGRGFLCINSDLKACDKVFFNSSLQFDWSILDKKEKENLLYGVKSYG